MKTIIGQFIDHIQEYEYTAGQPDGQSQYIDKTISEVFEKVAECHREEIGNHTCLGLEDY